MATVGQISTKDAASGNDAQVDGLIVANSAPIPSAGQALLQTVALRDGGGAAQNQSVDADGNAHVINGRVATGTASQVSASASAVSLLTSRAARVSVTIWNQGGSALYIGFANTVTAGPTGNAVWMIPPGQQWTMPVAYTGALYGIWDSTGGQANIADF